MKYLKYFETETGYTSYKNGSDYVLPNVSYAKDNNTVYFNPFEYVDPMDNYLTIEALEDGLTVSLSVNVCEYCVDGDGNWKTLSADTATETINTGQTLSFRGELIPNGPMGIGTFSISKKCNLKGNCMSMLFGDNAVDVNSLEGVDFAFINLFACNTNIINVSSDFLPATTLAANCYSGMFSECTSLTTAPELPATTLAENCYGYMFMSCTSLTTAPELPATTLTDYCYNNMFNTCTSLTTAPELPATTLTDYCYESMFSSCTSLTTAPELPATTLAESCYAGMFYGCTGLKTTHELPATTLNWGCYGSMFGECTSLTTAPELPATTLEPACYEYMFRGCTSLTTAPELPATTLTERCYTGMFYNCSKLNYIKMLTTDISARNCLKDWVYNVASLGTFVKSPDMTTLTTGNDGIPSMWTVMNDGDESLNTDNYLTIEALEDGLTASLSVNSCEYCVDGDGNWKTLAAGTTTETINTGQTLSFRGNLTPNKDMVNGNIGIGTFTIDKKCNLKGNCMSLLFWGGAANVNSLEGIDFAFCNLFASNTNIITVSPDFLPATTLSTCCYYFMFSGCTSLTTAPELPATTLAKGCYESMFWSCTSLTVAPELSVMKLAEACYSSMFNGCTSLTVAPELPATTLTRYCYNNMFGECTSLTAAPELPATTLAENCYGSMFYGCTSLTAAPELPATTLTDYCYNNMFYGCTGLTVAPELPAATLTTQCYYRMFNGCTSLTVAPELPATTLTDYCYERMFQDCTSLTTAPELPATTLANGCYDSMFQGCKKLNYIKMLATDISASGCLSNWVSRVSSTGTFVKHPDMTTLTTGNNGIPSGWTVEDDGAVTPTISQFMYGSTPYDFEVGMTWGEFLNSKYNTDKKLFYMEDLQYISNGPSHINEIIKLSDLIEARTYEKSNGW